MCPVHWDDRPSSARVDHGAKPLVRAPRNGFIIVWLLAPFRRVLTHWVKDKNTLPCTGPGCQHCARHWKQRIKVFAPVLTYGHAPEGGPKRWYEAVAEATEKCDDLVARDDLVGLRIKLKRHGGEKNGKVTWELLEPSRQSKEPPPVAPFDMTATLEKIYDDPERFELPPRDAADVESNAAEQLGELPPAETERRAEPFRRSPEEQAEVERLSAEMRRRFVNDVDVAGVGAMPSTNGHANGKAVR